jgi:hypothetical protein
MLERQLWFIALTPYVINPMSLIRYHCNRKYKLTTKKTPSESTLKVSRHRVQLGSKEFIFHHLQHLQLLRMILMDTPPCTETSYVKILFHSLSTSTTEEKEEVDTKTDESLLKSDEEDVESYPEGVLVTFALDSASSFELVAHLHVVFLIILKAQEIASEVFKRYHFDPQSSLKPSPVIVLLIGNKSGALMFFFLC